MKKDIFHGKILEVHTTTVTFTLILFSTVALACAVIFIGIAISYEKIEYGARILMYILGGLSGLSAVIYPLITLRLIRVYPKYRKLTVFFIQEYVFK